MNTRRFFFWIPACLALLGGIAALAFSHQPITVHIRVAEEGGFMPGVIKARVGESLRFRLIADNVEHTFALGQSKLEPVLVQPGQPVEVTLTFDKPGAYTFYTTTPSTLNFWRVRGTIEVTGGGEIQPSEPPLYVRLGLNLDGEEHNIEGMGFTRTPSSDHGEALASQIPARYLQPEYYYANSPIQTWNAFRAEPVFKSASDADVWDIVAYVWRQNTSPEAFSAGKNLYDLNCAACHGETGAGDGQFADEMKAIAEQNKDAHGIQVPTDFTNASHLLEAKPAVVQGLILRGGMGTGMPMWGSIFTEEQIWDLIAYLYSFQFEYHN